MGAEPDVADHRLAARARRAICTSSAAGPASARSACASPAASRWRWPSTTTMLAPVLSQPSLPFGRRQGPQALARALRRRPRDGSPTRTELCVLAMRFTGDQAVPQERFDHLREVFGDRADRDRDREPARIEPARHPEAGALGRDRAPRRRARPPHARRAEPGARLLQAAPHRVGAHARQTKQPAWVCTRNAPSRSIDSRRTRRSTSSRTRREAVSLVTNARMLRDVVDDGFDLGDDELARHVVAFDASRMLARSSGSAVLEPEGASGLGQPTRRRARRRDDLVELAAGVSSEFVTTSVTPPVAHHAAQLARSRGPGRARGTACASRARRRTTRRGTAALARRRPRAARVECVRGRVEHARRQVDARNGPACSRRAERAEVDAVAAADVEHRSSPRSSARSSDTVAQRRRAAAGTRRSTAGPRGCRRCGTAPSRT